MITKIDHMKEIGIFQEFRWNDSVPNFGKINMIFGYNGSGKTTLSNVLRLYSAQREDASASLFEDLSNTGEAIVVIRFDDKAVPYSAGCERKNIYVFNSDFVTEHVFDGTRSTFKPFDGTVVTAQQLKNPQIAQLETQLDALRQKASDKRKEKETLDSKFADIRKALSQEFNSRIKGSRSPSMAIPTVTPSVSAQALRKKLDVKYDEYALSKKQEELQRDIEELQRLKFNEVGVDFDSVADALSRSIPEESRKKIQQRLADLADFNPTNSTLGEWFEDGYLLLRHVHGKKQDRCPLCDSDLKARMSALIADYEAFFSEEYNRLTGTINALVDDIGRGLEVIQTNHAAVGGLRAFEKKYTDLLQLQEVGGGIEGDQPLQALENARNKLLGKKGNIAQTSWDTDKGWSKWVADYNSTTADLVRRKQNLMTALKKKSLNPEALLKQVKDLLVQCAYAQFDAHAGGQQVENYQTFEKDLKDAEANIKLLEAERNRELAKLRDESQYVNRYLKRLGVGHFEIIIGREKTEDNIRIQFQTGAARSKLRHCLSDSERTTLAFAYFLSKIHYEVIDNSGASMADTIVVIDDPISSLDESRLHVSACLIDSLFREAEQLFVLSHNVMFMKFLSNVVGNPKIQGATGTKESCRRDYYLCSYRINLFELPERLRNYRTTYFQRMDDLVQYCNGSIPYEKVKSFLPNYIRTVLETFLSFKFYVLTQGSSDNKYRSPGLDRLTKILKGKTHLFAAFEKVGDIDSTSLIPTLEKIRRITDPQVHGSPQDIEGVSFVGEQELTNIARSALDIISFLDRIHFDEVVGH